MNAGRAPMRVAVIDTDSGFIRVLSNRMDAAGWQYRVLASGVPPEELVAMKINAVVFDPDVIGEGGWEYLERICGMLPDLGVIVCANGGTVSQRVRGLRIGADDWVNKPCHPEEVIARIEAVVRRRRRHSNEQDAGPLVVGEIEIRPDQFQAFIAGQSLDLTRREFELIQLLAHNEGKVLDRESIYQRVWGYAMAHGDRSVDVFIRKLRTKLERRSPAYTYIHTHFGVGYRFAAESSISAAEATAKVSSDRATDDAGAAAPGVPV
ncbi:MAG TPA: response regulator transcription factor [Solirubrobacterales bacterium]|nr:response regulator transcription factor [Solirubrobacterales bacterium]HMX71139.1 response regulator transcription factor [Solirubrobacterales bacterium]HNC15498.1 response regulator transcription factor [Solirubrobacterales bacterium]HNC92194.1 response regulator transcription factor [Solirubrobacterales bacterium]HNF82381.1 response regulator transcription factor [Solirubrobacterales bacterium]